METTLNKIREHSLCANGWAKLLNHLGKTQADDEPLTILTVLESNGLDDALWCLRAVDGCEKEMRLYAVWCARQVQHLMTDPRSIAALDVAERYAKGEATDEELDAACDAAQVAARGAAQGAAWEAARAAARAASRAAAWAAALAAARAAAEAAAWAARGAARDAARDESEAAARDAAEAAQEIELRRVLAEIESEEKMKTQCGEVCASHGCTNSEGCPISTREQVEKEMGVWKPAKVGKRYHSAPSYAPSHWPKTLKALAFAVLIVTLFSMLAGFIVGVMV